MLEDHPKLVIGLVIVLVLAGFGVSHLASRHNARTMEAVMEAEEGGRGAQAPETSRLKEVRLTEYKDPDRALTLVEAIIASPADATEGREAREKHANILQLCFRKRLKDGRIDEARQFMDRLIAEHPDAYQITGVHRAWADEHKRLCRDHLETGRLTEARAILQSLSDQDLLADDARFLEDYQKSLAQRWVNAGASPDATEPLVEAAGVLAKTGGGSPLAFVVQQSRIPGNDLLALANAQMEEPTRFHAIGLYQAVLGRLNQNRWHADGRDLDWKQKQALIQKIEYTMTTLYSELGQAMESGRRPLPTAYKVEDLYREAASQMQGPALRAYLIRRQIRVQTMRLMEISKPVLDHSLDSLAERKLPADDHNALNKILRESGNLADDILRKSGSQLWASATRNPNFDPWPLVPATVKADFDERRKRGDNEDSLRQSLGSLANNRGFMIPLPELTQVRQLQCGINARRGLIIHTVQASEGVRWLQQSLAENADPQFRSTLTQAVSKALMRSRSQKNFEVFYELTRFFVGDIGLENLPAAQQSQFRIALGEVASSMAATERPKAIFLWAIQAEAYQGQPEGAKARTKAMQAAHQEVARSPLTAVKAAEIPTSGLPGVSVLAVDNSTEYHLLVFYKGPESFFLACRPYRKVSAITRDGNYEVAVITPSGAIQPYRGTAELKGSWLKSNYRIGSAEQDKKFGTHFSSSASGTYTLGHRPAGLDTVTIDPKTGGLQKP